MKHLYQIDIFDPQKPFIYNGVCFDPQDGSGSVGNSGNINYMGFVVFMKPQDFLGFCTKLVHPREESLDFFTTNLPTGELCISPPMLYLVKDENGSPTPDGAWRVSGHEGRHRANVLISLGFDLIPVFFIPAYHRSRDINEDFLDSISYLETERLYSERSRSKFFEPEFIIINKKVYLWDVDDLATYPPGRLRRELESVDWIRPTHVKVQIHTSPVPGYTEEEAHYTWSKPEKRRNPIDKPYSWHWTDHKDAEFTAEDARIYSLDISSSNTVLRSNAISGRRRRDNDPRTVFRVFATVMDIIRSYLLRPDATTVQLGGAGKRERLYKRLINRAIPPGWKTESFKALGGTFWKITRD